MTKNKDQKQLIRTRMQKTGESYTAARAIVVGRKKPSAAVPKSEWASLAGQTNNVVKEKTGRTWAEWVSELDAADAYQLSHPQIARLIAANNENVSHWWAQTLTVGYERIRGLRDVGQRRDGAYEANKSRTYAVDVSTLFKMFKDARRRRRWLSGGVARVRTSIENKSIRADWDDGTQVAFHFTDKGAAKATVSVQHVKLSSKKAVEEAKAAWDTHLDTLKEALR